MAASRNTVNQRNARARRKDYIASLEFKLQHYEQQGIQATREVQSAAQKVVDENQRLKEENERLRKALVEAEGREKELSLASSTAPDGPSKVCGGNIAHRKGGHQLFGRRKERPKRRRLLSESITTVSQSSQQGEAQIVGFRQQHSPPSAPHAPNFSNRSPSLQPATSTVLPPSLPENNDPSTPQLILPDTPPSHSPPQRHSTPPRCKPASPNTMPCTEAALIIAGVRGTHNPSDIYPDLGCASADVCCSVENLKVMEMMERD